MVSTAVSPTGWTQAMASFLASWQEKGCSGNTIDAYRNDMRQLAEFMNNRGVKTPNAATEEDLAAYTKHLEKHMSKATVARKLASTRAFFGFARESGMLPVNPAESLVWQTVSSKRMRKLDEEEIKKLLVVCKEGYFPYRNQAMVQLAVRAGLSCSEIVSLQLADLCESESALFVGTGQKRRMIPLPPECFEPIQDYVRWERPRIPTSRRASALFLSRRGDKMNRGSFWLMIKNFGKKAKIMDCCPQMLKLTAINLMLKQGMDADAVRDAIGLASTNKLGTYT